MEGASDGMVFMDGVLGEIDGATYQIQASAPASCFITSSG